MGIDIRRLGRVVWLEGRGGTTDEQPMLVVEVPALTGAFSIICSSALEAHKGIIRRCFYESKLLA